MKSSLAENDISSHTEAEVQVTCREWLRKRNRKRLPAMPELEHEHAQSARSAPAAAHPNRHMADVLPTSQFSSALTSSLQTAPFM